MQLFHINFTAGNFSGSKTRNFGQSRCALFNASETTVSALPWVEFDSFSLQTKSESPYYFPTIECGKMIVGERVLLPISITVSHAVCDGWHISQFIKSLEQMLNNPKEWINS